MSSQNECANQWHAAQVCELGAVRRNAEGVPLEVALTANLKHPNLLAARAHTIVRFARRSLGSSSGGTTPSRHTASEDGGAALPLRSSAGLSSGFAPVDLSAAGALRPGPPGAGSQTAGSGVGSPPAAAVPPRPLPGARGGGNGGRATAGVGTDRSPAGSEPYGQSAMGSNGSSERSDCGSLGSSGARESQPWGVRGSATPPRHPRGWDSPGAWGGSATPMSSYPNPSSYSNQGGGSSAGEAAGRLRAGQRSAGNPERGDQEGAAVAAARAAASWDVMVRDHGGGGRAPQEEGELWLLLDYCNRGCLAVRWGS